MLIRPAVPADAVRLGPLFEAWDHPQPVEVIEQVLVEWAATPRAAVLVADDDDQLLGMAAVVARPGFSGPHPVAHLSALVVARAARRTGLGGALLEAAESSAARWGCRRMELSSSLARDAAHRFYPARGYHDSTEHHAYYQKQLPTPDE